MADKQCCREKDRSYYQSNADIIRQKKKVYYKSNIDLIHQQKKDHFKRKADIINKNKKNHDKSNAESICQKKKIHYEIDSDQILKKKKIHVIKNSDTNSKRLMHQVGGKSFVDMNASSELHEAGRDNERDDCNNGHDYRSLRVTQGRLLQRPEKIYQITLIVCIWKGC